VFAYTGNSPTATGQIITPQQTIPAGASPVVPATISTLAPPKPSNSSISHTTAAVPTTHVTPPIIPSPTPVVAPGSPPASVLAANPAATQALPPAASPTSPGKATDKSSSSLGSGSNKTCRNRPSKRQTGLEYHRQHRRSSQF
jgi:hypothetical protein